MTAVEWLIEELKKVHHPTEAMIMYAKKLEKQQIIDAYDLGSLSEMQYPNPKTVIENGEQYYNETYGSKGSDEKINFVEIPQEQLEKERNPNYKYFDTSSQTEISDEEIEMAALHHEPRITRRAFKSGAKWYREQLKQRQ